MIVNFTYVGHKIFLLRSYLSTDAITIKMLLELTHNPFSDLFRQPLCQLFFILNIVYP